MCIHVHACIYMYLYTHYVDGPQEGDINIYNGFNNRVDVFVSGQWGTVSPSAWTEANSEVVCRQWGYTTSQTRKSFIQ